MPTYLGVNGRVGKISCFSEVYEEEKKTESILLGDIASLPVWERTLKKDDFPTLGSPAAG